MKNFKSSLAITLSAILLVGSLFIVLPSSGVLATSNDALESLSSTPILKDSKAALKPFSKTGYVFKDYSEREIEVEGSRFVDIPSTNSTEGSFRYDASFGDGKIGALSLTFTGKAVELYGVKEFDLGICQVFIDGVLVESVDLYAPVQENPSTELLFQKVFDTEGEHKIVVKGTEHSNPDAFASVFAYDYLRVYKRSSGANPEPTNTPTLVPFKSKDLEEVYVYEGKKEYTQYGRFARFSQEKAQGGYYMWTLGTGRDEISITFTGKVVELYTLSDSSSGIAAIYLDGEKVAEDDQYSKIRQYQKLVYQKIFKEEGTHTLRLVSQYKKHIRSDGPGVNFDFVKYFKSTATNTPEPTVAPVKPMMNGWKKMADGNIRYYVNDVPVKGVQTIGKTTYLFDAKGNQQRGWHVINGVGMYFNPVNGGRWTGLRTIGKTTYLLDAKRGKLKGWHIINGVEMYFDMQNGGRRTGLVKTHTGVYYLLSSSKGKLKGWHLINGKAMYFSPANGARLRVK